MIPQLLNNSFTSHLITQQFQKKEMLDFPPGGFNTFDEVWIASLVFPALMLEISPALALGGCCCCNDDGTCGLISCT